VVGIDAYPYKEADFTDDHIVNKDLSEVLLLNSQDNDFKATASCLQWNF